MEVWAVANQKGGVGKTTTAVALGGLLCALDKRVLLLDVDPHGSLSAYFKLDPDTITRSTFTLFTERKSLTPRFIEQLMINTPIDTLKILPASTALATLERQSIGHDALGLVLTKSLACIADDFDYAIIDCPPQLGVLMINALAACSRLLIPVQTEFLAIKGLDRMVHTLNMLQKSRRQPLSYSIVPTMFDKRTQASVTSLRKLRNDYDQVWPGKIPVDTKFRDASKAGVPPHLYTPNARGVESYSVLLKYLLKAESENEIASQAYG